MTNKIPYISPKFHESAFNCPLCNAYADQNWHTVTNSNRYVVNNLNICYCNHCHYFSIWYLQKMIYPDFIGIEVPNNDLSKDIKNDFNEAMSVLHKSPRSAAALLRLCIQKLCIQLGKKGKDLNSDIADLVKNGLSVTIQKSLDSVRVVGNSSVHPGQIDLKDDIETAKMLFKLVNFIAEKMITEPKEIDIFYKKLPENKLKEIEKRDAKK